MNLSFINVGMMLSMAAAVAAIGAISLAAIAWASARRLRGRVALLEASVTGLKTELELLASISATTGRRVLRVETGVTDVIERVDSVESRGPAATGEALDQAIEWARRGANTDKLSEQFGLSSGEADLVARLHGRPQSA